MILYIAIFAILTLMVSCSTYPTFNKSKANLFCFSSAVFVFWILSWIRWERGADWGNYRALFESATTLYVATNSGYEYLFGLLNYYIRGISSDYSIFLLIEATIIYSLTACSIYKKSLNPLLSIFSLLCINLGFIFFTRQTISLSIILYSFTFIVDRKPRKFFILVCIATAIHMSSFVFIFAYWLYYKRFSNSKILISIIAINIIGVAISVVILKMLSTLPNLFGTKIAVYLGDDTEFSGFGQSPFRVVLGGIVNKGGLLLLALYAFRHTRTKDVYTNGVINLYCAGYVLFMLFAPTSVALTRVAYSYDIMYVFLFPLILMSFKRMAVRKQWLMLFCMYLAFRYFSGSLSGPYGIYYVPYNTMFTKEIPMEIG